MKSVLNIASLIPEMVRSIWFPCYRYKHGLWESTFTNPPSLCPTGLATSFQGYCGKQGMWNGNNISGEVLQPLYVWGEAALGWQSPARAPATADPATAVPKVSGVMVFCWASKFSQLHQQVSKHPVERGRSQWGFRGCDELGHFFKLYSANAVFDVVFIHANPWISLRGFFS